MGAAMASCWHEIETEGMVGQPCPPTKLKYLTVMTAASTVLAKSVRFLVQGVVPVS